jgi:predicted ATP-grasp superfamily ATP-dependent carboligase
VLPTGATDLGQFSRLASAREPAFQGDVDALAALLIANAPRWKSSVLIPTSDLTLETLARHRNSLAEHYQFRVPPWPTVRLLLRKNDTYRIASRCGIEIPVNYGPIGVPGAPLPEVQFPVVIKPNDSFRFERRFGRKLFVSGNQQEFDSQVGLVREESIDGEILELIPGSDSLSFNYTAYYDSAQRVVADFPLRKIRKSPPFFGIGRVIETLNDSEIVARLAAATTAFVREAGWYGPVSAEFKLDARDSRRLVLMEVNGRCSFVQQLALQCGIDYAWLAYQDAAFGTLPSPSPRPWNGVLIHLRADILNAILYRRIERLSIKQLASPYLRNKVYAVWDPGDPMPFFREWARSLREGFQLIGSASKRARLRSRAMTVPVTMD